MRQKHEIQLMPVGTRVTFTKLLFDEACGDHPGILFAYPNDTGVIDSHGRFHHYRCRADGYSAVFGVNSDELKKLI